MAALYSTSKTAISRGCKLSRSNASHILSSNLAKNSKNAAASLHTPSAVTSTITSALCQQHQQTERHFGTKRIVRKKKLEDIIYFPIGHKKSAGVRKFTRTQNRDVDCAADADPAWHFKSSIVIQRIPVILPELEPWETEWHQYLEKRREKTCVPLPEEITRVIHDSDTGGWRYKTAEELAEEKTRAEEHSKMEFAPRITEDDLSGNKRSLDRQLDKSVYLIVKKDRTENTWEFPKVNWRGSEPLRDTLEDNLRHLFGGDTRLHMMGHAPIGHLSYKYPQPQGPTEGAKVFYFHTLYLSGDILIPKPYVDFAWVSRDEMKEHFPANLYELSEKMITPY